MKKTIGSILTVGGLIALIYSGIQYINESESFSFFGADVMVSEGSLMPVVISAAVMIIGIVLISSNRST